MFLSWIQTLLLSVAILGIPASLTLWILAFQRMRAGKPLLAWAPRQPVPWTLFDLLVVVAIVVLVISVANWWVSHEFDIDLTHLKLEELPPNQQIALLTSTACASMFAFMASLVIVRLRTGATARDFGIDTTSILSDLRLTIVAFTMLTVPMLAIQATLTTIIQPEDRHPFIDMILESPDFRFLGIITFTAIIVAPFTEEFLFRVLLIGWLERVVAFSNTARFRNLDSSDVAPHAQPLPGEESHLAAASPPELETIRLEPQPRKKMETRRAPPRSNGRVNIPIRVRFLRKCRSGGFRS